MLPHAQAALAEGDAKVMRAVERAAGATGRRDRQLRCGIHCRLAALGAAASGPSLVSKPQLTARTSKPRWSNPGVSTKLKAEAIPSFLRSAPLSTSADIETIVEEPASRAPQPYIAFEHVYKSFGDLVVLDDVSFFVNPGETLCILGRSGVGKSVALQHIMGFLKPDSGRIMVAGEDITGFDEKQLQAIRRKVTMVFQNGALFDSLSVGENVAFPLRERKQLGRGPD